MTGGPAMLRAMRFLTGLCALIVALSIAGGASAAAPNGESSKPIVQILADVEAAAGHAHSVYVVGSRLGGGAPLSLALRLVAGEGGEGMLTEGGVSFHLIRVGAKAYFEGGTAFWKKYAGAGGAELFRGRWIEAPATRGALASFATLTDISRSSSSC